MTEFDPHADAYVRVTGQPRYQPFIVTNSDGTEHLIQVWMTQEGLIDSVHLAHRDTQWMSWGLPHKAKASW